MTRDVKVKVGDSTVTMEIPGGGAGAMLQEAAVPSRDAAELLINLMDKPIFFCRHIEF